MTETSTFLDTARATIRDLMPVVLQAAGCGEEAATKKRDGSLVTVTDQQVETRLISDLLKRLPGVPVLGEEGAIDSSEHGTREAIRVYSSFMQSQYQLIIDPIDGTRNFVEGQGEYCIAAALATRVEGGIWPVASVIGLPRDGVLYWCDDESVFHEDLRTGRVLKVTPASATALTASVNSRDRAWLANEGLTLVRPWSSSGSSVYDLLGSALGRLCGSVVGSQRLWDLIPPLAIAARLGLVLRDLRSGEVLRFISPDDLSLDLVARPWGLSRRMILARPEVELAAFVRLVR